MKIKGLFLIVITVIFIVSCQGTKDTKKTINVLVISNLCQEGSYENNCLLVKWNKNQIAWERFPYIIQGFEYQLGYEYELDVLITEIYNPQIEENENKYRLIKVLTTKKVENETPDMHNSFTSLDWEGTYESVIPCADCSGIKTIITLNFDGSYFRSEQYLDKDDKPFISTGKFIWDENGSIITLIDQNRQQQYRVGEEHLLHLDNEGNIIQGALAQQYVLKKNHIQPIKK